MQTLKNIESFKNGVLKRDLKFAVYNKVNVYGNLNTALQSN